MILNNKNKNRIIKGVIGIIILTLSSVIAMYFNNQKSNDKSNDIETEENYNLLPTDSSTLVLFNNKQNNSNTGNVTNEYIMGDKVISNPIIPKANQTVENQIQERQPRTKIDKIENKGNLSIGQSGGIVEQTIIITQKPQERHLSENDAKLILKKIPLQYTVDVIYPHKNKESVTFANEIIGLLDYYSYKKITRSVYGQISPDYEESFIIKKDDDKKTAQITIYRQK